MAQHYFKHFRNNKILNKSKLHEQKPINLVINAIGM
jgi:hypothetical protein